MRAVVQRVTESRVLVHGEVIGQIGQGLLVLLGVAAGDSQVDASFLAAKIAGLRIFSDDNAKMNLSVQDVRGSALVISQFTLLGDVRNGRRPSFTAAAAPADALRLYEFFSSELRLLNIPVATGQFQADMQVHLVNDGPVTILLDSRKVF